MTDKILAKVPKLKANTTIGHHKKFQGGGIPWKSLKEFVFKLIDDGIIKV